LRVKKKQNNNIFDPDMVANEGTIGYTRHSEVYGLSQYQSSIQGGHKQSSSNNNSAV